MAVDFERDLLGRAFGRFQDLVEGDGVKVVRTPSDLFDAGRDDVWRVESSQYHCDLAIQAYSRFAPRDAERVISGVSRLMRTMRDQPILVVAPWLSPRSRELLVEQKINYLDLTGNAWLRLAHPVMVIRTEGAQSDPHPAEQPRRGLQGKGVNALVRILVDVEPPYRMSELARATGLSQAYVSRTIEALDEERLVDRGKNRLVLDVDWQRILRARAEHYGLIKSNRGRGYIARTGLTALVQTLSINKSSGVDAAADADLLYRQLLDQGEDQALVTGSFAVGEYVRIAAPTQLVLYVPDIEQYADSRGLMPADRGANVLLLRAADPSQTARVRLVDGVFHVGISQLVLDCLSGNGRLPEEGDALIEWMQENVREWRQPRLSDKR